MKQKETTRDILLQGVIFALGTGTAILIVSALIIILINLIQ